MIKSTQPTDIIEQTKMIKATELLQCHMWHITGRGTKHQNKNEITKKKNEVTRGNSNRIQTIIISSGPSHTVTVKRTCMLFHNIRKTSGIGKRTLKKKKNRQKMNALQHLQVILQCVNPAGSCFSHFTYASMS